ncbi:GNAT family N-acetyltransferase [Streptosporangium sp. NPDC020145]|uniref:GNAT family N-acetyltransferase n=1 Tax=Streptosporangium sp. NPDC020145 TaxID=3154694 RepID=UPI00341312BE
MIEVRVLSSDDWPLWRELRLAALAEAPAAFGARLADWQGDGDREDRWRGRLEIPGSHNVVAVLDGVLAGMASGVPAGGADTVELISMWVGPQARGRGVAGHLIQEIERWAALRSTATLRLCVMPDNDAAIALYRGHGFKDTGELGDLLDDGRSREIVMAKPLGGSGG